MRTEKVVYVPVSIGEFLDKVSVLRIKARKMKDWAKKRHVEAELEALERYIAPGDEDFIQRLEEVNEIIWASVDEQWQMVKTNKSGTTDDFAALSKQVLVENDRRFDIKREANAAAGSTYREEKQYAGRS